MAGYAHITTSTTTVITTSLAHLKSVIVNNAGTGWTITLKDGTATVAVLGEVAGGNYDYDAECTNGLSVVTASGTPGDITVTYE